MSIRIEPEIKQNWQLRVSLSKTAKLNTDNRLYVPSFDVGKTFTSQIIAVGVVVNSSKDTWQYGGYLSQEFSFASKGYNNNGKAFNRSEELLINDVSIINLPPLVGSEYRLRYFPPSYFNDIKIQIWEYQGLQTDVLLAKLSLFLETATLNCNVTSFEDAVSFPELNDKLDLIIKYQKLLLDEDNIVIPPEPVELDNFSLKKLIVYGFV